MGKTRYNTVLGRQAFASNGQLGLMKKQKAPEHQLRSNAIVAAAFVLLPMILIFTLTGEKAQANADSVLQTSYSD